MGLPHAIVVLLASINPGMNIHFAIHVWKVLTSLFTSQPCVFYVCLVHIRQKMLRLTAMHAHLAFISPKINLHFVMLVDRGLISLSISLHRVWCALQVLIKY